MRQPLVLFLVVATLAPIALSALAGEPREPALVISVTNVNKSKGLIRVAVYGDDKKRWLEEKFAVATASVPAKPGTTTVRIVGLAPGHYGIAVFHDKDGDGKLDKNFVGIPSEPYGFSRNPNSRLGPPDLKDARFSYPRQGRQLRIAIHSWL